ncbi:MAG: 16S rRNA (cytosine(1402)-N(4))-methyltransferase RsmH [Clostridiales bacterium]|nr:16S rRNA (cytosine(1402)-N(4))-methyltransferase RsmH [Clostridiales bacterium]
MSKAPGFHHLPVLYEETLAALAISPGGSFADGTIGGGGHSAGILERLNDAGRLYGIDRDEEALAAARKRLGEDARLQLIKGNFHEVKALLPGVRLDGGLLDLGVSSWQLDSLNRGFSYHVEAALDMRMDQSTGLTAAEWLNSAEEQTIRDALYNYADERWAARIAAIIIQMRQEEPFEKTSDLVRAVDRAIPKAVRQKDEGHPARRAFQAVRIAVNDEIAPLAQALEDWLSLIKPGGRLCVISFHSIEDRVVKQTFKRLETGCVCPPRMPVCVCGKKPQVRLPKGYPKAASAQEAAENPRARSARLRVAEKL